MAKAKPERTVAQRLADLESVLQDPQHLRNLLERTFDPRGGEPRIVDATGHTLPFQGAIQLMGGTSTIDPATQRVIYTPAGGGAAGMQGNFSDDGATSDDERARFINESDATKNVWTVDTTTSGAGTRQVSWRLGVASSTEVNALSEAWGQTIAGAGAIVRTAYGGVFTSTAVETVSGQSGALPMFSRVATSTVGAGGGTTASVQDVAADSAGTPRAGLTLSTSLPVVGGRGDAASLSTSDAALSLATSTGPTAASASITVSALSRMLLDGGHKSNYVQCDDGGGAGAPVRLVLRNVGGSLGAIAAGATATITFPNVFPGAAVLQTLLGGIYDGASAGSERCLWAWHSVGSSAVVTVTNTDTVAHTPFFEGVAVNGS